MTTTASITEEMSLETNETDLLAKLFGAGKYSPLMRDIYKDSQVVFGLDKTQAEKLARAVSSDFGDAMKGVQVKASVSKKATADGKVTCKEAASQKGITLTNALRAMQTLAWAADAGKYGLLWKSTDWVVNPETEMGKYLANL